MRIEDADVVVENNAVYDNRHGVVIINADAVFTGNSISNNDRDGVYSLGGTLDFFSNTITANGLGQSTTIHGIFAASGSDINVGGEFGTEGNPGYNEIYDNEGSGVHVSSNSTAFMGHKVGYGGYNSVHGNGAYSGYDVDNLNTTTVSAHKNWWGTASPSSSQFNGDVDYNFHLTSPPAIPKVAAHTSRTLLPARRDRAVLDSLKTAAASAATAENRGSALVHYYSLVRRDKGDDLAERANVIGFLDARMAAEHTAEVKSQAFILLLDAHRRQGQHQTLLHTIAALPEWLSAGGTQAAYTQGIFANVALADYAAAERLLQVYAKQFAGASEIVFLQEYIDGARGTLVRDRAAQPPAVAGNVDATTAEENGDLTLQAAPNPFNPATRLHFRLAHEGEVTLRIFDMLGKEVRTFAAVRKPAGAHVLAWDGRDNSGVEVGSGVYFARLTYVSSAIGAQPVAQSRKLLLVR